uniref:Uncharacterized protein n=1 Tax=Rhizophora mucronata TaxID=61149 RepID=A0A2P2PJ53_RHIMU
MIFTSLSLMSQFAYDVYQVNSTLKDKIIRTPL